jgi:hypothetical protein
MTAKDARQSEAVMLDMEIQRQTSMAYWFPRVADLHVPETVFIALPITKTLDWMDKGIPPEFVERVRRLIPFEYPVFIRTDYASGKHSWKETCFVRSEDHLGRNIYALLEANELADIMGLPYRWLVVREYVPMQTVFEAFHGDMPINHEHRYFVRDGGVECRHPYWPMEAFEAAFEQPKAADWKERLKGISDCPHPEVKEIAGEVALRFKDWWSVDFSLGNDGKWYLIDMARGEISYHWPGCPMKPVQRGAP